MPIIMNLKLDKQLRLQNMISRYNILGFHNKIMLIKSTEGDCSRYYYNKATNMESDIFHKKMNHSV